jgi:hypothetical protein
VFVCNVLGNVDSHIVLGRITIGNVKSSLIQFCRRFWGMSATPLLVSSRADEPHIERDIVDNLYLPVYSCSYERDRTTTYVRSLTNLL